MVHVGRRAMEEEGLTPFYPVVTLDGVEHSGGVVWGMSLAEAIYDSMLGGQFDDIAERLETGASRPPWCRCSEPPFSCDCGNLG